MTIYEERYQKALANAYWCPICYEAFSDQVWHCPICAHHWPMSRTSCWNCHQFERGQKLHIVAQKEKQ